MPDSPHGSQNSMARQPMTESEKKQFPPFDPLQVNLPQFDGPLDLLLHLVRKQALDINELRLADLTEPYLAFMERMDKLDLDQAGEFLSIAATLVWIKSKSLLPKELNLEEPEPETVEEMLLLRLQEYHAIKEAAHDIGEMERLGRDVFPRQPKIEEIGGVDKGAEFEEISIFGLIEAFREVLERSEKDTTLHIVPERERIEEKIEAMLAILSEKKTVYFHDLFIKTRGRGDIILTFIALLELIRLQAVRVVQTADEIFCRITEKFITSGNDWKSLLLGSLVDVDEGLPVGLEQS